MERLFWNVYACVYDGLSKHFVPYKKVVKEVTEIMISACPLKSVALDAGCGTGNFSIALGRAGYKVFGIDISKEMLKRAVIKAKQDKIPIQFQQTNLTERLPYKDNTFDAVISINALYMLPNPEFTLKEFHRILKHGGKLILSNPMYPPSMSKIVMERVEEEGLIRGIILALRLSLLGILNIIITRKLKKGIYFYWNKTELTEMLSTNGFNVEFFRNTYVLNANSISLSRKM